MKSPFQVFKKNTLWYGLTIFVTALSSIGTLILSKQTLGNNFILFNLQIATVTFINTFALGWFNQSLNRFFHQYHDTINKQLCIKVSLLTGILITLPIYIAWTFFVNFSFTFYPFLFIILHSLYSTSLTLTQSSLNAKKTTVVEAARSTIVIIGLLLNKFYLFIHTESFFWIIQLLSLLLAYCMYILPVIGKINIRSFLVLTAGEKKVLKKMIQFGFPLSSWMFISFCILNIDKWYLLRSAIPRTDIADYVALSDLMSRTMGFIFSPIVASAYPIISRLFDLNEYKKTIRMIEMIIFSEIIIALFSLAGLYFLHPVLFSQFKIKYEDVARMLRLSVVLLVINAVWQVCGMLQKSLELTLRTSQMLKALLVIACFSGLLMFIIIKPHDVILVAFTFAFPIFLYFIYCLYSLLTFKKSLVGYKS